MKNAHERQRWAKASLSIHLHLCTSWPPSRWEGILRGAELWVKIAFYFFLVFIDFKRSNKCIQAKWIIFFLPLADAVRSPTPTPVVTSPKASQANSGSVHLFLAGNGATPELALEPPVVEGMQETAVHSTDHSYFYYRNKLKTKM